MQAGKPVPRLHGKTAVVSGGSRSLGLFIAEALIREGARVAITGRHAGTLEAAARKLGAAVVPVVIDIRDPASVRTGFARIAQHFGALDILVNNAALMNFNRIETAADEALAAEIETNLLGAIYCIRSAVPLMRDAGGGDIVNITSESVRFPFPGLAVYAATKAALETLSLGLRDELRADGIRVAVLRCGNLKDIGSGLSDHWQPEQKQAAFALWTQTGHMAMVGQSMRGESVAQALTDMLALPRDAGLDLVEVRGR